MIFIIEENATTFNFKQIKIKLICNIWHKMTQKSLHFRTFLLKLCHFHTKKSPREVSTTHIICFFIEICSVHACIDLRENISYQASVGAWSLAITVTVTHSQTATSSRPPCKGTLSPSPTPPCWFWNLNGRLPWRWTPCAEQLRELQGKSPSIPSYTKMPGAEKWGRWWVMKGRRMMGAERMRKKGLLLWSVVVGVGGADTKASSNGRSPTKAITPTTKAVGAWPAAQKYGYVIFKKYYCRLLFSQYFWFKFDLKYLSTRAATSQHFQQ